MTPTPAARVFAVLVDDVIRKRIRLTPRHDTLARVPGEGHPLSIMTPEQRREYNRLRKAEWRAARATANAPDKRPQESICSPTDSRRSRARA